MLYFLRRPALGRRMMLAMLWCLALIILMSACSVALPRIGPEVAKAVNRYCAAVSPGERAVLRAELNAQIAPHAIAVTCDGDAD